MSQFTVSTPDQAAAMRPLTVRGKPLHFHASRPEVSVSSAHPVSREAKGRLSCLRWHGAHGRNVSLTCRHFAISRPTFYRWQARYQEHGVHALEDRSHRPRRCRRPSWSVEQVCALLALRERYPCWGKAKLAVLLRREGHDLSVSMVGRILWHLRRSGQLREGIGKRRRSRRLPRPYAIRKPKGYVVSAPGDLVQVDTLDVAVVPGSRFKHLSLVDVVCRWHTAEIRHGATARTMRENLDAMRGRLPFALKAIQVDGGSEFRADFEVYCQQEGITLFTLPPRSPKLNGVVERVQRVDREEFYACTDVEPRLETLQPALRAYEDTYNTVRPHQALGYLTPQEYLDKHQEAA